MTSVRWDRSPDKSVYCNNAFVDSLQISWVYWQVPVLQVCQILLWPIPTRSRSNVKKLKMLQISNFCTKNVFSPKLFSRERKYYGIWSPISSSLPLEFMIIIWLFMWPWIDTNRLTPNEDKCLHRRQGLTDRIEISCVDRTFIGQ